MDQAKGPNPYFEGLHEGESDELRNLRLALVSECKDLRETLTAVSDALDYLHGMTPQQAADVRKAAERYRWMRNSDWDLFDSRWLSAHDVYGAGPDELDALIDAKMAEDPAVG